MQSGSNINANFPSRYRVESQLGEGAAGIVYLALDTELGCKVVIKALRPHVSADPKKVARFENEFNLIKQCRHKNVIRVFDFSEFKGTYFFTMEYLQGKTLHELIHSEGVEFPLNTAIEYLIQIADGLLAAHQVKLVHRDLKPGNVFVTEDKQIKLLDFGIARQEDANFNLTGENEMLGTPYYMSPEQYAQKEVDHRSDIYSFGIMAFELLTKQRPFDANAQFQLKVKHSIAKIPSARALNPEVPVWLEAIITTCMQKKREDRYDSIAEVLTFLRSNGSIIEETSVNNPNPEKQSIRQVLGAKHNRNLLNAWLQKILSATNKVIIVVLLLGIMLTALIKTPLGPYSNEMLLRTLFSIRNTISLPTIPNNIVIVALDDVTYQELDESTRLPFPRKYWAEAITNIQKRKPAAIIVDAVIQKESGDEEGDRLLEEAIKTAPVVLMNAEIENKMYREEERNEENKLKYVSDTRFRNAASLEVPMLLKGRDNIVSGISTDEEAFTDRVPLSRALSFAGLEDFGRPGFRDFINFYGPPGSINRISLYKLLGNPDYDFNGKIVLMGMQSMRKSDVPGAYDVYQTSGDFSEPYFGVEIHATILANLIDRSYIKSFSQLLELAIMILLSFVFFYRSLEMKSRQIIVFYVTGLLLWFVMTVITFLFLKVLIPGVFLMLCISLIAFCIIFAYRSCKGDATIENIEELAGSKFR